jgi:hypothetical protein
VSMNPFKFIDSLYTEAIMKRQLNLEPGDVAEPHIFGIGAAAFHGLRGEGQDQAVIISGESGAGKTEATKKVLQFLASAAGSALGDGMEQRLLAANPILEAFGNAKTVRNNNSSRFGKWMVVHFNGRGQICGSEIVNYLLEKSRVIGQAPSERNYHGFYQLCLAKNMARKYFLQAPEAYRLLNQSGCISVPGMPDDEEFVLTCESTWQITSQPLPDDFESNPRPTPEYECILEVVALVLHIGNIEFEPSIPDDPRSPCRIKTSVQTREALKAASTLFGVTTEELSRQLTFKTLVTASERLNPPLEAAEAEAAQFSLAKTLYGRMFDWLVRQINSNISGNIAASLNLIGVLDIFGFEIFEHNSFEQLCINFCNEKLQQHFNLHVFKQEEKCYIAEEIDYSEVNFEDNQDVLDVIEKPPVGLLIVLDDEVKSGARGSDPNFLSKVKRNLKDTKRFAPPSARDRSGPLGFVINHYAGSVMYDAEGFLDKNKDEMMLQLQELCGLHSKNEFIQSLFVDDLEGSPSAVPSSPNPRSKRKARETQGAQFRRQLDSLMSTLNKTFPHYVRCIKSNSVKKGGVFEAPLCLRQLRYAGVFEAVKIRQQGYPFRWTHDEFYKRYRCVAYDRERFRELIPRDVDWKRLCMDLLGDLTTEHPPSRTKELCGPIATCKLGKTMVLYRAEPNRILEMMRDIVRARAAMDGCRVWRGYKGRQRFRVVRAAQQGLVRATKVRELDALIDSIRVAEAAPFHVRELGPARVLRDRLQDEKDCREALASIEHEDPVDAFEEYQRVIAWADRLELEGPDVDVIKARFATVRDRREAKEMLLKGTRVGDRLLIETALDKIADLEKDWGQIVPPAAIAEAKTALDMIRREDEALAGIRAALSARGGSLLEIGPVGAMDVSALSVSLLEPAIASLEGVGLTTKVGRDLLATSKLLVRIRRAFLAGPDWAAVESTVTQAVTVRNKEDGISREALEEVARAEAELNDRSVRHALQTALAVGRLEGEVGRLRLDACKPEALDPAIASGDAAGGMASASCKALLEAAKLIRRLRAAMKGGDWHAVRKCLTEALTALVPTVAVEELQLAKDELDNRTMCAHLSDALSKGGPAGEVGDLDVSTIDVETLNARLQSAADVGPRTHEARVLFEAGEAMLRLRAAVLSDGKVKLKEAIQKAREGTGLTVDDEEGGVASPVLTFVPSQARDEVEKVQFHFENEEITKVLRQCIATGAATGKVGALDTASARVDGLQAAMKRARELVCRTSEARWLFEVAEALSEMRAALKVEHWSRLQSLINGVRAMDGVSTGRSASSSVDSKLLEGRPRSTVSDVPPARSSLTAPSRAPALSAGSVAKRAAAMTHAALPGDAPKGSQFSLPEVVVKELATLQGEIDNRLILETIALALSRGGPTGPVGKMDVESINTEELEVAVARASSLEPCTPEAKLATETGQRMLTLRSNLKFNDWATAEVVLSRLATTEEEAARARLVTSKAASAAQVPPPVSEEVLIVSAAAASEVRRVREEANFLLVMQEMISALETHNARGKPGAIDLSSVKTEALDSVIDLATDLGTPTEESQHRLDLCRLVWKVRRGLLEGKWDQLEGIVRTCGPLLGEGKALAKTMVVPSATKEEVALLRLECDNRRALRACREALQEGRPVGDIGHLSIGLIDARPLEEAIDLSIRLQAPTMEVRCLIATCLHMRACRLSLMSGQWERLREFLEYSDAVRKQFGLGPMDHSKRKRGFKMASSLPEAERLLVDDLATMERLPGQPAQWALMDELLADGTVPPASWVSTPGNIEAVPFDLVVEGLAKEALPELGICRLELNNRDIVVSITHSLTRGMATGSTGHLDVSTVDVEGVQHAVERALALSPDTVEAKQMVETGKVVLSVRSALAARDWDGLERALGGAQGKVLADIVAPEIRAAQDELDNRAILLELQDALGRGRPQGETGRLYTGSIELRPLEEAIELAMRLGCKTPEARHLLFTAKVCLRLRHALLNGDYHEALLTLEAIRGKPLATTALAEIRTVQDEIDNWTVVSELSCSLAGGRVGGSVGALELSSVDTGALESALSKAEELGIKTREAHSLRVGAALVLRMRRALLEGDWDAVEATVKSSAGADAVAEVAASELALVSDELDNRRTIRALSEALEEGGARGSPGALDLSGIDTSRLDHAIALAMDLGCKTPASDEALTACKVVRRLRATLVARNWDWVHTVLEDARSVRHVFPEVSLRELQLAQDELDNRSVLAKLVAALRTGGPRGGVGELDLEALSTKQLDQAIDYARSIGCRTIEASQMLATANLVRRLRQSLQAGDLTLCRELLEGVKGRVLAAVAAEEVQAIKLEVDNWTVVSELTAALQVGGLSVPIVGDLDVATVDVHGLDEAIALAMKYGCHTPEASRCLETCLVVRRIRQAVIDGDWTMLHEAVMEQDLFQDDKASEGATTHSSRGRLVAAAKRELAVARDELELRDVLACLGTAADELNEAELSAGLARAARLGLQTHPRSDIRGPVDDAQSALDRLQRCKAALHAARKAMSAAQLVDALAMAASIGLEGTIVESAREALVIVRDATERAAGALRDVDTARMEASLSECEGLGISLPLLTEIRQLLALPRQDYLHRQLASAVKQRDEERVAELTMEVKQSFFDEPGKLAQYAPYRYPLLKPPHLFSAGYSLSAPRLEERMMSFQSEPITTCLTRISDGGVKRAAVRAFRCIQSFMGDRAGTRPVDSAVEVLNKALEDARGGCSLSDEILLQVIKQLTANEHPDTSGVRGWCLLHLMLSSFAPSEDLEHFVEAFLRSQDVSRKTLRAMHRTLFRGAREQPFVTEEVEAASAACPPLPLLERSVATRIGVQFSGTEELVPCTWQVYELVQSTDLLTDKQPVVDGKAPTAAVVVSTTPPPPPPPPPQQQQQAAAASSSLVDEQRVRERAAAVAAQMRQQPSPSEFSLREAASPMRPAVPAPRAITSKPRVEAVPAPRAVMSEPRVASSEFVNLGEALKKHTTASQVQRSIDPMLAEVLDGAKKSGGSQAWPADSLEARMASMSRTLRNVGV